MSLCFLLNKNNKVDDKILVIYNSSLVLFQSIECISEVSLGTVTSGNDPEIQVKGKKQKVPRRILHFSDGILEEYSTDEEEEEDQVDQAPPVDPVSILNIMFNV